MDYWAVLVAEEVCIDSRHFHHHCFQYFFFTMLRRLRNWIRLPIWIIRWWLCQQWWLKWLVIGKWQLCLPICPQLRRSSRPRLQWTCPKRINLLIKNTLLTLSDSIKDLILKKSISIMMPGTLLYT